MPYYLKFELAGASNANQALDLLVGVLQDPGIVTNAPIRQYFSGASSQPTQIRTMLVYSGADWEANTIIGLPAEGSDTGVCTAIVWQNAAKSFERDAKGRKKVKESENGLWLGDLTFTDWTGDPNFVELVSRIEAKFTTQGAKRTRKVSKKLKRIAKARKWKDPRERISLQEINGTSGVDPEFPQRVYA